MKTLREYIDLVSEGPKNQPPGEQLVKDILAAVPATEEIWFHGSRATGKHKANSDTDILVIVPRTTVGDAYLDTVRALQQVASKYYNYDIQPSHPTNNIALIAREEGKQLWAK
jgi:predicted nucleotidyltransferase